MSDIDALQVQEYGRAAWAAGARGIALPTFDEWLSGRETFASTIRSRPVAIIPGVHAEDVRLWLEQSRTTWGNRELSDILPEILGSFLVVMERIEQEESEREQDKWARLEHNETK